LVRQSNKTAEHERSFLSISWEKKKKWGESETDLDPPRDWIDGYHQDFDAKTFIDFFGQGNPGSGSPIFVSMQSITNNGMGEICRGC
jgi:hypothetical protein